MKGEKQIRVTFCPKCKSRKVVHLFSLGNLFGVIPKMKCKSCGFVAPIFPVLSIGEKDLKKSIKKIKRRHTK